MTTREQQRSEMYSRILKHGHELLQLFPQCNQKDPLKLCKALRRYESKASYHSEQHCSVNDERHILECGKIFATVALLLGPCSIEGAKVILNLDPRGYALKIEFTPESSRPTGLYSDMGGYGILAPDLTNN